MNMGQLVFIHGSFAKAFSTFAKLFFECGFNMRQQSRLPDASIVSGPVAQWMKHRSTETGIAGSSPAGVILLAATVGRHAAPSRVHQSPHKARELLW
jgi:hypothetical protein